MSVDEIKQQIMELTNGERARLLLSVNAMRDKDAAPPEPEGSAPSAKENDD